MTPRKPYEMRLPWGANQLAGQISSLDWMFRVNASRFDRLLKLQVKADVQRGRRVSQSADGNQVYAGLRRESRR